MAQAREYLDEATLEPGTLEGNLRDLRRINRVFGGSSLSLQALRALVSGAAAQSPGRDDVDKLRVLDVGTGAADIPLAMVRAHGPWRSIGVTAVDSRPEVLDAARRCTPALNESADVVLRVADGRSLPFGDGEFDVAHASLVLHHLEPGDARQFVCELARVARVGVIVNDLTRGAVHWLGAWLVVHALSRNRFTRHDGPLSVRRAYTAREARGLLAEAGLVPIHEGRAFAGHRWTLAAVRQ